MEKAPNDAINASTPPALQRNICLVMLSLYHSQPQLFFKHEATHKEAEDAFSHEISGERLAHDTTVTCKVTKWHEGPYPEMLQRWLNESARQEQNNVVDDEVKLLNGKQRVSLFSGGAEASGT